MGDFFACAWSFCCAVGGKPQGRREHSPMHWFGHGFLALGSEPRLLANVRSGNYLAHVSLLVRARFD